MPGNLLTVAVIQFNKQRVNPCAALVVVLGIQYFSNGSWLV